MTPPRPPRDLVRTVSDPVLWCRDVDLMKQGLAARPAAFDRQRGTATAAVLAASEVMIKQYGATVIRAAVQAELDIIRAEGRRTATILACSLAGSVVLLALLIIATRAA